MGCWNETCGLSHLPIFQGEDAVLVILKAMPKQFVNLAQWHDDMYTPVAPPLYGKYNDYGTIEPDSAYADYHQRIYARLTRDQKPEDRLPLEEALDEIIRGDFSPDGGTYAQIMFRRSVWDVIMKAQGDEIRNPYDDAPMTWHDSYLLQLTEAAKVASTYNEDRPVSEWSRLDFELQLQVESTLFVGQALTYVVKDFVKPGPVLEQSVEGLLHLLLVSRAFAALRLGWAPTFGSGSQEGSDNSLVKLLAEKTIEEIEVLEKRWDEY